ncbi:MAG: TetR/AcrR family transcriptional regulator [Cyanobacteria bacterium P01_E01_bin.42]
MPPAKNTKTHIIQAAIALLKVHGIEGLTMRKVATQAEMSLGNLQYHFKDKTALMAGLAEHYFGECESLLDDYQHTPIDGTTEEKLRNLIFFLLDHVDCMSDMCRIFREIWALSTRDEDINIQLIDYYKVTMQKLSKLLILVSGCEKAANDMASLLMPYIEGYSIVFPALPQSKHDTMQILTKLCCVICQDARSTESKQNATIETV